MRRFFVALAVVAAAAVGLALAGPASAADEFVVVIEGNDVRGVPGTTVTVADQEVPAELVGRTCEATLNVQNNGSVHPQNDLVVTTAGKSFEFDNFETAPGQSTIGSGEIEIGERVLVELRFGTDGRSSGELSITVTCDEEVPPTTTVTVPTSEVPGTTVPSTTIPTDVQRQTTVPPTSVPAETPDQGTPSEPNYTG